MVKERKMVQTEIGLIPDDWDYDFAGKYLDFLTGFPFKSDLFSNHGTKLLRGSNVKRNEVVWNENLVKYWENIDFSLNKYLLKKDDIVISMDGSLVGRSFGQIKEIDLPCLLVQRVARLRGVNIHTNYLKQYYCSEYFTAHCDNNKTSSAIPHISPKDILEFKIAFPKSLPEQEAIASALSDADAWIESLEQLIAKKQLIKQGAMQELLTPKEDWEVKKLGDLAEVRDGTHQTPTYVENGIPFYSVESVTKNDFKNTKFITEEAHKLLTKTFRIEKGDILMTRIGSIGDCKLVDWEVNASFYVSLALIKVKQGFLANYLCHYSKTENFRKEADVNSLQSAIPKKINLGPISNIKIEFPSLPEQTRIANILSDMDVELEALATQLAKAKKIKQGMMQELLTGRIRLV